MYHRCTTDVPPFPYIAPITTDRLYLKIHKFTSTHAPALRPESQLLVSWWACLNFWSRGGRASTFGLVVGVPQPLVSWWACLNLWSRGGSTSTFCLVVGVPQPLVSWWACLNIWSRGGRTSTFGLVVGVPEPLVDIST